MAHQAKRYTDKFEAYDYTAGKYHPRKLSRHKYRQSDLLDYLAALDHTGIDPFTDEEILFPDQR